MKKAIFIITLIVIFTRLAFAEVQVKDINISNGMDYVKGEVIVKFKNIRTMKKNKESFSNNMKFKNTYSHINIKRISIPKDMNEFEALEIFKDNPDVEYAHLNYTCKAHSEPNDPYYSYQWNFHLINMNRAWNIQTKGSDDIIVAVLDTGVAYESFMDLSGIYKQAPDLKGTVFCHPYDFINDDLHANDDRGHGTHVTGTICQSTNNDEGLAGMAYGISIMPIKVLDYEGIGSSSQLADGIYWAVDHGANVINMSLGFPIGVIPELIPQVTKAINYAYENDVIMVASSGNEGEGIVSYPAAYPEIISVGAVHSGDVVANYSQYGINLEIVAPGGEDINRDGYLLGTDGIYQQTINIPQIVIGTPIYDDFRYRPYIGTSMAAPHVTGLTALLLSQNTSRTITDIRDILHTTSVDLGSMGWDEFYGYGRIDAFSALNYDKDSDGFSYDVDCDDNDSNVYPGAEEICDGKDNDCDGNLAPDEIDADADGFGICEGDCDDTDPAVHPGATEITCDGKDNDCSAVTLDDPDADSDGASLCTGDCDDTDPTRFPGNVEVCDGIDNDCDGEVDEDLTQSCSTICGTGIVTCQNGEWLGCDAQQPAQEICGDGIDQDCDGSDLLCPADPLDIDNDADGYTENEGDCDDTNQNIYPGTTEICGDGIDQDCDGSDLSCPTEEPDPDPIPDNPSEDNSGNGGNGCFISIF